MAEPPTSVAACHLTLAAALAAWLPHAAGDAALADRVARIAAAPGGAILGRGVLVDATRVATTWEIAARQARVAEVEAFGALHLDRLVAASEADDLALIEVDPFSAMALERRGLAPLELAPASPAPGAALQLLLGPPATPPGHRGTARPNEGGAGWSFVPELALPPGSAGAPVLDGEGRLVGICTSLEDDGSAGVAPAARLADLPRPEPEKLAPWSRSTVTDSEATDAREAFRRVKARFIELVRQGARPGAAGELARGVADAWADHADVPAPLLRDVGGWPVLEGFDSLASLACVVPAPERESLRAEVEDALALNPRAAELWRILPLLYDPTSEPAEWHEQRERSAEALLEIDPDDAFAAVTLAERFSAHPETAARALLLLRAVARRDPRWTRLPTFLSLEALALRRRGDQLVRLELRRRLLEGAIDADEHQRLYNDGDYAAGCIAPGRSFFEKALELFESADALCRERSPATGEVCDPDGTLSQRADLLHLLGRDGEAAALWLESSERAQRRLAELRAAGTPAGPDFEPLLHAASAAALACARAGDGEGARTQLERFERALEARAAAIARAGGDPGVDPNAAWDEVRRELEERLADLE